MDFPKLMKKGAFTYGAQDQKDYDAHIRLGWREDKPYEKFPMVVSGYGTVKTVGSEEELAAAVAAGFVGKAKAEVK